jgi:hypothetical protein
MSLLVAASPVGAPATTLRAAAAAAAALLVPDESAGSRSSNTLRQGTLCLRMVALRDPAALAGVWARIGPPLARALAPGEVRLGVLVAVAKLLDVAYLTTPPADFPLVECAVRAALERSVARVATAPPAVHTPGRRPVCCAVLCCAVLCRAVHASR